MSVVVYSSNDIPVPCKCGTIPEVGMTFYYKSKYTGSLIEGIIGKVGGPLNIFSTNGAMYRNDEIELKPLHVIRSEKLNDLGI
jgi:hypothetical protein